jgi:integrase
MPAANTAARGRAVRLDTPAKRAGLPPRGKSYFVPAGAGRDGASLGYRRTRRGAGTWVARLKDGAVPYEQALGVADDAGAPAGSLTFAKARAAALAWCEAKRAELRHGAAAPAGEPTVAEAAAAYLGALAASADARAGGGRGTAADTKAVLEKHLLGGGKARREPKPLASRRLGQISRKDLQGWLRGLDDDLSPSSVARVLNTVRAVLRGSWARAGRATPPDWHAVVRDGLNTKNAARPTTSPARQVEDIRPDILSDADVVRLLHACEQEDPDLHRLVVVIAATGLRFSQVVRMRVRDVDAAGNVLSVPVSAKGDTLAKETHGKATSIRVHVSQGVIEALRSAMDGRRGDEVLLQRDHHSQPAGSAAEGRGEWRIGKDGRRAWVAERRAERRPWKDTAQITRPLARAVEAAGLPAGVTTYHLRDWSIIRLLRAGLDPVTVARRHDTSVAMIERAYGRHILGAQEAALRAAAPVLSPPKPSALQSRPDAGDSDAERSSADGWRGPRDDAPTRWRRAGRPPARRLRLSEFGSAERHKGEQPLTDDTNITDGAKITDPTNDA